MAARRRPPPLLAAGPRGHALASRSAKQQVVRELRRLCARPEAGAESVYGEMFLELLHRTEAKAGGGEKHAGSEPRARRAPARRVCDRLPAMTELGSVAWPPAPIRTERLVLRESEARDRAAFIELFTSPEVGAHIGGPRPRDELERAAPEVPGRRPGHFVIELDGAMIGTIELNRRDAEHRSHVRPDADEAELGYLFLPEAWGRGYAAEACAAALGWFAEALPGEPVVLYTQTANDRSMRLAAKLGFTEVQRFEEWGAEQWFGVWSSDTPSG